MSDIAYKAELQTPLGVAFDEIDDFVSISYARSVNVVGNLSIVVPDFYPLDRITSNTRIILRRKGYDGQYARVGNTTWFVRTIRKRLEDRLIELHAEDTMSLLERRRVAYTGETLYADKTLEEYELVMPDEDFRIDNLMRAFIAENFGAEALDLERNLEPYFSVQERRPQVGDHIFPFGEKQASWANCLTVCQELARLSEEKGKPLFFDVVPVGDNFEFRIWPNQRNTNRGSDSIRPILFSRGAHNLTDVEITVDYKEEANVVYVLGSDSGASRIYRKVVNRKRVNADPLNRIETVYNAGGDIDVASVLDDIGYAVLNASRPKLTLTGRTVDTLDTIFGRDYNYGDRVVAGEESESLQVDSYISAMRGSYQSGREDLEIRLQGQIDLGNEVDIPLVTDFITVWRTNNEGESDDNQIKLPLPEAVGAYNFDVLWGDGSYDTITASTDTAVTHTYPIAGTYTVIIRGRMEAWRFNDDGDKLKVLSVDQWGDLNYSTYANAWKGCSNLVINAVDAPNLSQITDFTGVWQGCSDMLYFPDVIDVSTGENFTRTWEGCSGLYEFPLLDFSSGTTFTSTWKDCSSLSVFPEIDTTLGADFQNTWQGCASLLEFPELTMSAGTNFAYAWEGCENLSTFAAIDMPLGTDFTFTWGNCTNLPLFPLIDVSGATQFYNTWQGCSSLIAFPEIDFSGAVELLNTWRDCAGLTSFPYLDLSNVESLSDTWNGCVGLEAIPAFDLSNATFISNPFAGAVNINEINILGWNASFSIEGLSLEAPELEHVFNNLTDRTSLSSLTITIIGNPGIGTANQSIATAKNWVVTDE